MSSDSRVSIPTSVRKMIQNIKEITDNHSEEEIHAMLKECSMDPNETAQKLLLQDTFHEVKRKRDRKKENLNKDSAELRWKPSMQEHGNRGGRGSYSSHYMSHDAGGGRGSNLGKENEKNQVSEKVIGPSLLPASKDLKNTESTSITSSSTVMTNGPTVVVSWSTTVVHAAKSSAGSGFNQSEETAAANISEMERPLPVPHPVDANKNPTIAFGTGDTHTQSMPSSSDSSSMTSPISTGVYFSASDPVLVPSQDSWLHSAVGTIRREVGNQRRLAEQISVAPAGRKSTTASEVGSSMQGKITSKSQGAGKNQLSESSQLVSSARVSSPVSRSSSSHNNRPQVIGPQKVGPSKEWKPKPTIPNFAQGSGIAVSSEVPTVTVEVNTHSRPALSILDSKEVTSELRRKLKDMHITNGHNVTIPNHLHVPEAEKLGFCFGSFDASFGLNTSYNSGPETDSPPLFESSIGIEETMEKQSSSNQNTLPTADEGDYPVHSQASSPVPENLSSVECDVSSNVVPEYSESKRDTVLPAGGHQYSVVHTSPSYSSGFMPPILGSQLASFESSESQARDVSRLPSFVVQQPFDPTSYYAQFYRYGADTDGRISPFHSAGVATKYNGNVAVISPEISQFPQEAGNSLVLSTAGPTPLVTQAAGLMQSSLAVTQQPLPIFQQPTGMHLPHYPMNYIPYGPYFSPFHVPPPAIHQFLSNVAFPQQPQGGSIYHAPQPATAKYSLPQYKPGTNAGNSNSIGLPGYGPYGPYPAGYNPSSAPTAGNSTSNEDLALNQFKESNVYVTGPQNEGSGIWIATPGRDISGLQAGSFYHLPQGQVAFTPTQAGHGTFAGIYHPAQPVTAPTVHPLLQQSQSMGGAVDMVGPTGSVYQQPQHAQMNWPSSY